MERSFNLINTPLAKPHPAKPGKNSTPLLPSRVPGYVAVGFVWAMLICLSAVAGESGVKIVARHDTEVEIALQKNRLIIRPLADNAVRIRVSDGETPESPSLLLTEKVPAPKFELEESRGSITVSTAKMKVVVDRSTGALNFQDANGKLLLAEKPGARLIEPSTVQGEPTFAVTEAFLSPPDERLFGSGQFQDGHLNIRDLPRRLTQVNSQIAVPFLLSSKGDGLLWHNYGLTELNPADERVNLTAGEAEGKTTVVEVTTTEGAKKETRKPGEFTGLFSVPQAGRYAFMLDIGQKMARRWYVEVDGKPVIDFINHWLPPTTSWHMDLASGEHTVKVSGENNDQPVIFFRPAQDETVLRSPVADAIDYVVFAGNADEVIGAYRKLSGPAPLMPEWTYGYIHCRERFKSQQEILDTAAEFRRRGLPMDLIVQDWQYWGRYGWNAMRFDEANYPDPAAMVRELHGVGARLMVSVWSKIGTNSEVGKQFVAGNYFIPGTQWVDFFNPGAAALYWSNFSKGLLSLGIDAWWQDATEPENDDVAGRRTFLGPGEKVRDIYPLFVTKTVYEGQRRDAPDKRVFILTRSAFSGEQRYAAATWSGDIGSDWETLRRQIPAGLDYMAAGLPYWTTDCGGFFRPSGQYTDAGYQELFIRWFEYATFCPLQRVHGYRTDTEFWRFGTNVEDQAHRYLDLRYRLLPYIYSQAARVTFDGSTLMRPLVMDFPGDTKALDQKYEYMFGPALLVSPVLEGGVTNWSVYLPKNDGGWIDFWTGEKLAGSETVTASAPLKQIPLHVRAGSIIPFGPEEQYTGQKPLNPIELRIYPGANGGFTLYEDEGVNYNYEKGEYTTIPFTWNDKAKTLIIGQRQGQFPGMLQERVFRVVLVHPGHGGGIEPCEESDREVRYSGEAVRVKLAK
jgi:alpha-D-xyloside xylohydrolase